MVLPKLTGVIPPVITPMKSDYSVDEEALRGLVRYMQSCHVDGIFAMGTAAESPMLTREQRLRGLLAVREECKGKSPLLVGVMETSTARVLELVKEAEEIGADAVVAVSPYFFRVKPKEIVKHFAAIREATELPIVIYNVPAYTGNPIDAETVYEIAQFPGVVAFKDSSGNMPQFQKTIRLTRHMEHFSVLQGVQVLSVISLQMGAAGLIPGVANMIPRQMVRLYEAVKSGRLEEAYEVQDFVVRLEESLTMEGYSLSVLKAAPQLLGFGEGQPHYPLDKLSETGLASLAALMRSGGVELA
ncbi:dihydrodipicolinate synthase family protein [Paenibacillus allorhizosphaerae]|uniref:4-hydroxy-tetrahydrodipicolinate synthase n=1 Tax=Paenibacillus allorhizosphaerae TaxID=2849866 RepID=A0ABM8VJE4_9BACL|nr:dihydrodipicolinate synthase family protein [Paenibacillus allorhizosphaerae]CAG7645386.1 4-hydroxy-tetrahydrodipicolinate synthase [Paenibacillus allorhizosphaerae]